MASSPQPQMHRVTPFQLSYQARGLKKTQNYQFWVNADTSMGEGPRSQGTCRGDQRVWRQIFLPS